jgi:HD-GYP domain-containing protein (c-di-GMP phosphodiesterase class II)
MTSDTHSNSFRPVNIEFLAKGAGESFDIFLQSDSETFVKFASTDPKHQDKVLRLLEEGEIDQEFYIREEDLFKYYQYATQSLRSVMNNPKVPLETKTKKIYEVSQGAMKEFFSYNASTKILESSEEVMDMMEDCLSTADAGFAGISQITSKDYYTHTHSVNVGLYCMTFGTKVGLPKDDVKQLGLGGMLHDVGKSKIDTALINKNGKLNDEEFERMKSHSPMGAEMLTGMCCYKDSVINMAGQHHEKFKGGGYPQGLAGDEISMHARICKIMDVYDALTTRRSYKKALNVMETLTIMTKQMANDFDPKLLELFIKVMGPSMV